MSPVKSGLLIPEYDHPVYWLLLFYLFCFIILSYFIYTTDRKIIIVGWDEALSILETNNCKKNGSNNIN